MVFSRCRTFICALLWVLSRCRTFICALLWVILTLQNISLRAVVGIDPVNEGLLKYDDAERVSVRFYGY